MKFRKVIYFSAAILGTLAMGATTASASHASRVANPRITNMNKSTVRVGHRSTGTAVSIRPRHSHKILGHVYRQKNGTYLKAMNYSNKYVSKHGNPYNQPDAGFKGYSDYLTGGASLWNKPSIEKNAHRVVNYRNTRKLARKGVPFRAMAELDMVNPKHDKEEGINATPYYLLQSLNHHYKGWMIDTGVYSDSQAIVYPKRNNRHHKVSKRIVHRHTTKRNKSARHAKRNKRILRKHARRHMTKRHAKRNIRKDHKYDHKLNKRVPVMKSHNTLK